MRPSLPLALVGALLSSLLSSGMAPSSAAPEDAVLVGAGDIASCALNGDSQTAALVENIAGTVFAAGDTVYESGTLQEFRRCYAPTWGRFLNRTRPAPRNHEYRTPNGAGYYAYFGSRAGNPGEGYYAFTLGAWRVIVLNSNIAMTMGSAQDRWLEAELNANPARCTVAIWHHPRFSSGQHGSDAHSSEAWKRLYTAGVELVLNGHDHNFERFAPQTPNGSRDDAKGIRQFVVGTGGASLRGFNAAQPNSQIRDSSTWGVLKLTLKPDAYTWQFVPVAGKTFTDAGSGRCH
jgi:hypothetical protein